MAVAVATVMAGCSSGGDGEEAQPSTTPPPPPTTSPAPTTTEPEPTTTTAPVSTDPEPTDPPTTPETAPPTTTEEELKAQIAADYVRSWELRNELTSNPTLENLDARVAEIAAVGTPEFDSLKAFVEELVAAGERVVSNEPDLFSITVEDVLLTGTATADVTTCFIDNRLRVNASGTPTGEFNQHIAIRGLDRVAATSNGWLPDGDLRISWRAIGVVACPSE